jgi:MOSC domain-containing protein
MNSIGTVESLWRYPVKSMRGEEMTEMFAGFSGIYGDRLFAFRSSASRPGFPHFTARDQRNMILYRPRFRNPAKAAAPINLAEAQNLPPGANPVHADPADLMLDVETPAGRTFPIDDPALIDALRAGIDDKHVLTLKRSERGMTDCRPLSMISVQTVRTLTEQTGATVDKRRFRANIYLDLPTGDQLEEHLVGHSVRIGSKVVLAILERDPRCMMITLDPETADKTPAVLKTVAQGHGGMAGVYAAVLSEGIIRTGDVIEIVN